MKPFGVVDKTILAQIVGMTEFFEQLKMCFSILNPQWNLHVSNFVKIHDRDVLGKWNRVVEIMFNQCLKVGPEVCLMVYYEQLVLQPIIQSKRILNFLDIPWNDAVLNHEKHISNISLSK